MARAELREKVEFKGYEDIKAGDHVHTHNIKTALGDLLEYKYVPKIKEIKVIAKSVITVENLTTLHIQICM